MQPSEKNEKASWRPSAAGKERLDSLLPDRRKAPRQSPTRRLRPAVLVLLLVFLAYELAHMWREPGMRAIHPQIALLAGVMILLVVAFLAGMLKPPSSKGDDKQSTLKL